MRNFISRFQSAIVFALTASLVSPAWAEDVGGDPLAPPATSEVANEGAPTAPANTAADMVPADAPMPSDGVATGGSLDSESAAQEEPAPKPAKKKKAKKLAKKKDKKKNKKNGKKTAKKNSKKKKNSRQQG